MALKTCRVTIPDMTGVEHSAVVIAGTLYEAAARGLATLQKDSWAGDLCQGRVKVAVYDTPVEHEVWLQEFKKWLERTGSSPRETSQRQKLREILGMP